MRNVTVEKYRTTREVLSELGIKSETTLLKYKKLLSETTPEEWKHEKGAHWYSPESFESLKKVRGLFKQKFTPEQIKEIIIKEGI